MSYIIPNIPRSNLGLAHDLRSFLEVKRRKEIFDILRETERRTGKNLGVRADTPKDEMIRIGVAAGVDFENTPPIQEPHILPELSIHELRKMVHGLTKPDGTKWEWKDVTALGKDDLKAIMNDDYSPVGS